MEWIGAAAGFVVGAIFGIVLMALAIAGRDEHDDR